MNPGGILQSHVTVSFCEGMSSSHTLVHEPSTTLPVRIAMAFGLIVAALVPANWTSDQVQSLLDVGT